MFVTASLILLVMGSVNAAPIVISIADPDPGEVTFTSVGGSQLWPNAGTLAGSPISLKATVKSLSPGGIVSLFKDGDDPIVRARSPDFSTTILWEVFDANTGAPVSGDIDLLIADIDGLLGNSVEKVSARCHGLSSYTTNGIFLENCRADVSRRCHTNIRVTEANGNILAEGTQSLDRDEPEGHIEYRWTDVSSWTVSYFSLSGDRWFAHDGDRDLSFDSTEVTVNIVDLATIKKLATGSLKTPAQREQITYEISLSNAGPEKVTNATITDQLPAGLQYVSHNASSGTYNPATGLWNGVDDIAVDGVETLTITAEVTAAAGSKITNSTTKAVSDESLCSDRDVITHTFTVPETKPELTLIKTSTAPSAVAAGAKVVYNFSLTNSGNVTIRNVEIADAKCPVTPLTFSNGYLSGDSGTITGALDVGETWKFSCEYTITQADIDTGVVQNTATASGTDPAQATTRDVSDSGNAGDGSVAENDPTNTSLLQTSAWTVTKSTSSVPSKAGDSLDYEFLVTNTGNVSISAVNLSDPKCATAIVLDSSSDTGSDDVLSPAGLAQSPSAEQWRFTCTSIAVTQAEVDAGKVDNEVTATGQSSAGSLPEIKATNSTPISADPKLSLVKSAGSATLNGDGSFNQSFNFNLKNTGNVTLANVVITDDIAAQFGSCFVGVVSAGTTSIVDNAPTGDSATPASASAPQIATVSSLAVGDKLSVANYMVRLDPNANNCVMPTPLQNTATATGNAPAGNAPAGNTVSDVSNDGVDPQQNTSNDSGVPTPFTVPAYAGELGFAKEASTPSLNIDGSFDVSYSMIIKNTGNLDLGNIAVSDDLVEHFEDAFTPSSASADTSSGIISAPVVSEVSDAGTDNLILPTANTDYDGGPISQILMPNTGLLGVGDVIRIRFSVRINPLATMPPVSDFSNIATVTAQDPVGATVMDNSNDGSNPENGAGGEQSATTVSAPGISPKLEVTKQGVLNPDGYIEYTFILKNVGDVNIKNIALSDDNVDVDSITYTSSDDADSDKDIDVLSPSESAVVTARHTITKSDIQAGQIENQATATGKAPGDVSVSDESDSLNLGDDKGTDKDPTTNSFSVPSIGMAKALKAGSPVDLGDGSYLVSYQFVVKNLGDFSLNNVQIVDDLNAMINNPHTNNASFSNPVVSSPNNTFTPNSAYDGSKNTNLLSGTDNLLVGETGLLELTFHFTPDQYFGPFLNQAVASSTGPHGEVVDDVSEDGTTVHANRGSMTTMQISTPSTPIRLGWFKAERQGETIVFNWATEVEVSNAGFYLSVIDEKGRWHRINPEIILSKGDSINSQSYQYTAQQLEGTQFILSDVSVTGVQVDHGPFDLGQEYGIKTSRKTTDWQQIKQESESKEKVRDQQHQQQLQQRMRKLRLKKSEPSASNQEPSAVKEASANNRNQTLFKRLLAAIVGVVISPANAVDLLSFEVEQAGLYRVTHKQLKAKGLDLTGVDIDRIGLKQNNQWWPLKITTTGTSFETDSQIIFPAQGLKTLYTGKNKYILVIDEGEPYQISDDDSLMPKKTALAPSYLAEKSYAPQNHYTHISPSDIDSWYADSLKAVSKPAQKQVNLTINDYAPAINSTGFAGIKRMPSPRPRLEVELWGASNLPGNGLQNPDHHVLVSFNGETIADESFDGLHLHSINKVLTQIVQGNNSINVSLPKDHGYQFDLVNLDRISIRYPRLFKAINNGRSLVFESSWNFFKISDLVSNQVTIVRVDEDRQGYLMTQRGAGSCTADCVYFAGSEQQQNSSYYLAVNNAGFLTPKITALPTSDNILVGQAEYLIIAHPDFIGTASQSLELYANQLAGEYNSVDIVDVNDIYARYSGHIFDAKAIQAYIKQAYAERNTRHVLLVGGDVYDYHNNLNNDAKSFIPSLYVAIAQNVNAVPSDAKYADIDGDLVPDISISRLPVRSSAELSTILSKRQYYLQRNYTSNAVFAADKTDGSGYSFKGDAQNTISQYFNNWQVSQIYRDDVSNAQGRQNLRDAVSAGASLTSYFGHSSTDRWTNGGLLTSTDIANLNNAEKPTVVAQWGCWNTFYVAPEEDGLAHQLLVNRNGAVTIMGATSFTKAYAEKRMANLLYDKLKQGMRIGDAVLAAKRSLAAQTPHQLDILLGWTVLGPDDLRIVDTTNTP